VSTLKIAIVKYQKLPKDGENISNFTFVKSGIALIVLDRISEGSKISYHMISYEKGRPFLVEMDEEDFQVLESHLKKEYPQFGAKTWNIKYYPKHWLNQIRQFLNKSKRRVKRCIRI
jgi:hypothetical protein